MTRVKCLGCWEVFGSHRAVTDHVDAGDCDVDEFVGAVGAVGIQPGQIVADGGQR